MMNLQAVDPILVVDDDAEHLYMLKTVLSGWGYKIETAKSGLEALEFCRVK